jgi:hypothetical protein
LPVAELVALAAAEERARRMKVRVHRRRV